VRTVDAAGAVLEVAGDDADRPVRRLWHGEYDAVERRLSARFFVGAASASRAPPPELRFQLA
jgi:hypothetical protein